MEARRLDDPADYAGHVLPFLLRAPARHNLYLALLDTLQRHPTTYPEFHLWIVEDQGDIVGAAMQTPPHNIVLAEPGIAEVVDVLVDAIGDAGVRPPGVVGGVVEAHAFADAWGARHGGDHRTINRQGIYELTTIRDRGSADGGPRLADADDLALLLDWHEAFLAEAVPDRVGETRLRDPSTHRRADRRRRLSGSGRPTARSCLVDGCEPGPTRRRPRRPGLHAARSARPWIRDGARRPASAQALAHGATRCYLHTDLANPTSNAIYRRIGYEWVCEATEIRFRLGRSRRTAGPAPSLAGSGRTRSRPGRPTPGTRGPGARDAPGRSDRRGAAAARRSRAATRSPAGRAGLAASAARGMRAPAPPRRWPTRRPRTPGSRRAGSGERPCVCFSPGAAAGEVAVARALMAPRHHPVVGPTGGRRPRSAPSRPAPPRCAGAGCTWPCARRGSARPS